MKLVIMNIPITVDIMIQDQLLIQADIAVLASP
jgi:hypothetical protein